MRITTKQKRKNKFNKKGNLKQRRKEKGKELKSDDDQWNHDFMLDGNIHIIFIKHNFINISCNDN